jgi:hypothetical protein
VRNERRMLGSERGYEKPMIERSHGARSLLYCVIHSFRPDAPVAGGGGDQANQSLLTIIEQRTAN